MKKLLLFIPTLAISFVCVGIIIRQETSAQILEKTHRRTFTLQDEFVHVEESKETNITTLGYQIPFGSYEAFTIFYPIEDDPEAQEKQQLTLNSIKVTDINGNSLAFETQETDSRNIIVKVLFPQAVTYGFSQKINISYDSYGLLVKGGEVRDMYIPGFPENYQLTDADSTEQIFTTAIIPAQYGQINFVLPETPINVNSDGARVLDINFDQLVGNTTWVQIGSVQYFEFEFSQVLPQSSKFPFILNAVTMPIPRDVQSGPVTQEVFFTEITPNPFNLETDIDGNLIATFKVPANKENTITVKGYGILTFNSNFNLTNSGSIDDIPAELINNYTSEARFWEVNDPEIQRVAAELKGSSTDIFEITNKTYNFVINQIDYSFVKKSGLNERKGALETLQGGAAVCMEYSDLFIALMRAQGVPARAAFGYGYSSLDYEAQGEKRVNHQWAEVYLPAQDTWINVDTTWGDFGSTLLGGDLSHFYSHIASVDPETPSSTQISYLGVINNLPDKATRIEVAPKEIVPEDVSSHGKTQAEILGEYSIGGKSERMESLKLSVNYINSDFDSLIENLTGIQSEQFKTTIKVTLLLSPVILFVLIYILKRVIIKKNTGVTVVSITHEKKGTN